MKGVLLFPGQGSQFIGMGQQFYQAHLEIRKTFEEAESLLGFNLSELCFNGPAETLNRTSLSQLAIYVCSVGYYRLLMNQRSDLRFEYAIGLSLGEYSALAATQVLSFKEALLLVQKRGELMEKACELRPGGMAAVFISSIEELSNVLEGSGLVIANLNTPGQIVVSGPVEGLDLLSARLKSLGIRMVRLRVQGAFHSPLMASALAPFEKALCSCNWEEPTFPLILNSSSEPCTDPLAIRDSLLRQLVSPVFFHKSIERAGLHSFFLECGPGTVLQGLVKKIGGTAQVLSFDQLTTWDPLG